MHLAARITFLGLVMLAAPSIAQYAPAPASPAAARAAVPESKAALTDDEQRRYKYCMTLKSYQAAQNSKCTAVFAKAGMGQVGQPTNRQPLWFQARRPEPLPR